MIITDAETIEKRLAVCANCPASVDKSDDPLYFFTDAIGSIIPNATKTMCSECSCPIWVKVRVVGNTCPLNKWEE